MNLNLTAIIMISFIPLIIGAFWYQPRSPVTKWSGVRIVNPIHIRIRNVILLFICSFIIVQVYVVLIIHQVGFYELFFTDIMHGNEESELIVQEFLSKYGDKHRHFGHGIFHGTINAFVVALPFLGIISILENKGYKYCIYHFLYWLLTSMIIGGLISEFV